MNQDNMIFEMGNPLPEMFSQYFIGKAYLNMLTTEGVPIGNVTFEPGCRNNWHIHHKGGQILLVTSVAIIKHLVKPQENCILAT